MPHSLSGRRSFAGDVGNNRFGIPRIGDVLCRIFLGSSPNLSNQYQTLRPRILPEHFQHIHKTEADDRVPSDSETSRLPDTCVCEGSSYFIGQGSASRRKADAAWAKNVTGHYSKFRLPGRDHAWSIGANDDSWVFSCISHYYHLVPSRDPL